MKGGIVKTKQRWFKESIMACKMKNRIWLPKYEGNRKIFLAQEIQEDLKTVSIKSEAN